VSTLPPELERLVAETLARSKLDEGGRTELGSDLRAHLREGLDAGRTVEELALRFGDPETAALLASRARPPANPLRGGMGRGGLETMMGDIRHGIRALRRTPSLTLTATIVLSLGVSANAVVFTVMNELLLSPLPVNEPDRLADVWADTEGQNSFAGFSWQAFEVYRDQNRVFDRFAAFMGTRLELGEDGPQVVAQFVTPQYFDVLEQTASIGSMSFAAEGAFGEPPVAVLAHGFWQDALGGDPSVLGSALQLGGRAVTVIGVGPPGFAGHFIGFRSDMWLPMSGAPLFGRLDPLDPSDQPLEMIGRLRPGVSIEAAQAALGAIALDLRGMDAEAYRGHGVGVTRTTGLDHSLAPGVRAFVAILTAIALMVLIVACLNVGSILLVRAMARERELAVRIALGAGRARLFRTILTESLLLVVLGGVVGMLTAQRLNGALVSALLRAGPGVGLELTVDRRVLMLTAAAAVLAAVATTVVPTLYVLRRSPAGILRGTSSERTRVLSLRSGLVVGQVCVSVVLVIATGLFARALVSGGQADPGFDPDRVAFFSVRLPEEAADRHGPMLRDLLEALRSTPGIEVAAAGSMPPVGVSRSPMPVEVPGVAPPPGLDAHVVDVRLVDDSYLSAIGVSLAEGRGVSTSDLTASDRAVVVSVAFRDRFMGEEPAVGRIIRVGGSAATVVGVARDIRFLIQDDTPDPLLYLSTPLDTPLAAPTIVLRADRPAELETSVTAALASTVSGDARVQLRWARETLDAALLPQRMGVLIVGAMGLAALFLSAVGLYGLVQFTVARQTRELGVRLALGGGRLDLATVVLRKGLLLVGIGTVTGVAIGAITMRGLTPFLNDISPTDPLTYGAVVTSFLFVALLASWLPARKALRIEPKEALGAE
jgi:predicted permease